MTAMMSLVPNMLPRFSSIVLRSTRLLSTSPNMLMKDIKHTEEGNKIVVEGIKVSETSTNTALTASGCGSGQANCHPFCNSPIVGQVKHTDVLILDQFVDSKGQMYSQEDLEICPRQWTRLHKLVQMCQRAGLMPGKEFYAKDVRNTKWGSQNSYWNETTIDMQYNVTTRKQKTKEFTTGIFRKY